MSNMGNVSGCTSGLGSGFGFGSGLGSGLYGLTGMMVVVVVGLIGGLVSPMVGLIGFKNAVGPRKSSSNSESIDTICGLPLLKSMVKRPRSDCSLLLANVCGTTSGNCCTCSPS